MTTVELEQALLEFAKDCAAQGPGYAQDTYVLREAAREFGISAELAEQQALLTAWHDLFRKGALSWGYDVENPSAPFFHIADR